MLASCGGNPTLCVQREKFFPSQKCFFFFLKNNLCKNVLGFSPDTTLPHTLFFAVECKGSKISKHFLLCLHPLRCLHKTTTPLSPFSELGNETKKRGAHTRKKRGVYTLSIIQKKKKKMISPLGVCFVYCVRVETNYYFIRKMWGYLRVFAQKKSKKRRNKTKKIAKKKSVAVRHTHPSAF